MNEDLEPNEKLARAQSEVVNLRGGALDLSPATFSFIVVIVVYLGIGRVGMRLNIAILVLYSLGVVVSLFFVEDSVAKGFVDPTFTIE